VPGPVTAVPEADTKLPGLAVSDPDAGADPVKLTLAVGHGTLTVDSGVGGGITVSDLGANSAASVTMTAPQAAINATLGSVGGVVYHPDSGFIGVDMLTVTTEDQGHNGSGPALTDVDTVGITVVDAAPAVKTTSPAGGATDVPLAGNVTVTFSEPVAVAGDWVHVNCAGSGLRTALSGLDVSGGPTTFTLDPIANFAFADSCTVSVLAAGVRDQDTNDPPESPVADATFAFTTVDIAPTVTSTSPADGATGVPTTTGVTVTFSEPVTTTLSAFSLTCGASPVALATVPAAALGVPVPIPVTSVTFAPAGTLPPGTNCTVGIAADAVHDSDTVDPPDTLAGATGFSFSVPPVAAADTYAATGNMAIAIPAVAPVPDPTSVPVGVLANDTGPSLVVDQVQGGLLTVTQDTAQAGLNAVHGHVTMAPDGGFTYDPPPGFTGADSFTYRINGPGGPATATVTINVSNLLWFVCHGCPGNNRGTLVDPFTSTGAFTAVNGSGTGAPAINQSIYLESASGNFTGVTDTLVLKDGQKVYGQGRAASDVLTPAPGTVPAFGTLTAGARPVIAPTTGNGITLASGNSLYDLNVGGVASTSSAIASKVGTAFGTLTVRNVTLQGTGQALTLNNGTADAIFDSVTSSSGATNISLTSVNGSLVVNGGTLSGATTRAVNIDSGTGTITLAGNIDATKGINVDHKTGGTVTFSGATKKLNVITAASPAVTLGNNPNTTIAFSGGGLDIDTTSGNGFLANGMATALTVTGSGNTINSTTGTALSVTGATIGAAGLNFDTIAANGAVNGIVLSGTGSTGGLTAGGGTIQNTTGDGVLLIDTVQVALTNLTVKGAKGSGINGTGVTGFSLTGATVDGNGDDAGSDEAGIRFDNLWGTAAITNSTVTNSIEDNARIRNTLLPALNMTVTGSTFGQTPVGTPAPAPSNDGLLLEANQTANVTATVVSSTFQNNWASGLQAITNDGGTLKLDVGSASAGTGGTFKDNNVSLNVAHDSTGTMALTMQSGAFSSQALSTAASPINLNLGTGATAGAMTATVKGNTISNNHSPAGPGIRVNGNGTGTLTALIDSNTVTDVANRGIEVIARNGSNHVNATVTNNAVTLGDPLSTDAIRVDSGSVGTDTTTVCADVAGNQATTTGSPGPYYGIRLHRGFPGVNFLVKGMPTGASNPDAAVILYLAGRNTATVLADSAGAAGFSGTATCPTP
ncbi:MAG: hypothetical protein QOI86_701, partial [Actinomycetota bacterium]|nr:hypothetical protein [Actinomycetota bacterium]